MRFINEIFVKNLYLYQLEKNIFFYFSYTNIVIIKSILITILL